MGRSPFFSRCVVRLVVVGSREWHDSVARRESWDPVISPADVDAEARRRKAALKLDEWQMREYVTGRQMPEGIRHLALQIDFAANAISRLSPIPADFADDIYWPSLG